MQPNPFPGMNPWLEEHWGDVHTRLTTYASDALQPGLPAGLRARVEEYVSVETDDDENDDVIRYSPDVRILERPGYEPESGGLATAVASSTTTFAEPIIVRLEIEPTTQRRLQIIDTRSGNRVVTSIEFLSRTNKRQEAEQFVRKQNEMLRGGANIVEIDLLRGPSMMSTIDPKLIPNSRHYAYRACVITAQRPTHAAVYSIPLRHPLPTIRIPLRPTDEDVPLNLQALIDQTYINGGYEDLDYSELPSPALSDSDAQWAAQVLKDKGLR